jgi:prepilin-type processing-associated H-X9-DG protein
VAILPYIEEKGLKDQYDFNRAWFNSTANASGVSNLSIVSKPVAVYRCPSADGDRVDVNFSSVEKPAAGDYGSVNGVGINFALPILPTVDESSLKYIGVLNKNVDNLNNIIPQCKIKNITDGVSKTIMIVENAGRPNIYFNGRLKTPAAFSKDGTGWADPDNGGTLSGVDTFGNAPGTTVINGSNDGEPYSFHVGGAQFCFADGSAHFIQDTITAVAFQALVTRSGGEPGVEF